MPLAGVLFLRYATRSADEDQSLSSALLPCLQVVGPVQLHNNPDARDVSPLTQPRPLAVLAYLLLARPRGAQLRADVIRLLWPQVSEAHGRRGLRNALYLIRQALGREAIVAIGERLIAVDPHVVRCDAFVLESADGHGYAAPVLASLRDPQAVPFADLHLEDALSFMQWVGTERERLLALKRAYPSAVSGAHHGAGDATVPMATTPAVDRPPRLHAADAFTSYLRGHYLFLRGAHGGSPDELQQSRSCFERALEQCTDYPPALAGLSNVYAVVARRGPWPLFAPTFSRAIAFAERAAVLDPSLAIPHVHFGVRALYLDDAWDLAGREFGTAAFKEPDYAEGRRFYGVWLGLANRHADALREMEAAARLEPDIPHILSSLGAARMAVGDVEGAEAALRRTLEVDPRHRPARERLLRLLEGAGRFEDALAEQSRVPGWPQMARYEEGWHRAGATGYAAIRREALQEELQELERRLLEGDEPSVNDLFAPPIVRVVSILRQLGENKRAHAWQLQACAQRGSLAHWFASLPDPDGRGELRSAATSHHAAPGTSPSCRHS